MCFMTVLSTDSPRDLAQLGDAHLTFSRSVPALPEAACLEHAHRWYLGSREGCSCGFRHLMAASASLGFGAPEDWYPEDVDDVAATLAVVAAFKCILADGAQLDCVDGWASDQPAPMALAATIGVDLGTLPAGHFRFIENHRFTFTDATVSPGAARPD